MKTKYLVLAGVGVALLGSGGYAANRLIFGQELTPLGAAELVPQEAFMTAYLSTDVNAWKELAQSGLPKKLLEDNWEEVKQGMLADSNIDYSTDIQPWLGGMALALMPSDASQALAEPEFLVIVGIKNKLKAYQFLKKIEQESKKIQTSEYQGIKITENQSLSESSYVAVIGNQAIFATKRQVIEKAIDTYQGSPSLADNAETKTAFAEQLNLQHSLGQIYLTNYKSLLKSVEGGQTGSQLSASPVLDEVKYMVLGIGAEEQSLQWRSLTKFNSDQLTKGFKQPSGKLLAQLPENSISVVNGSNINQIWANTASVLAADPNLNGSLNMLRGGLQMSTGLDLEQDIFGWMDGEYALGLIPTQTAIIPELGTGLGGALLLETQQKDLAQKSLVKLESLLQSTTGTTPTEIKVQGKTMTQWREPSSNFTLTYGWMDDNSLIFTAGEQVAESIGTKFLAKSDKFNQLTKQLPEQNFGYVYLDMNPLAKLIHGLPDNQTSEIPPETIELVDSIDSIGATSTMPDSTTVRGDLAIRFHPSSKP
jgi:hypothetical protein